tara:strand:+ start:121 stop:621 length:501 start_codon:yes stop_codon:yes gene_type:complete
MANPMYGQNKSDNLVVQAKQRTVPSVVKTDLANDTASITLAIDGIYRIVVTNAAGKPLVLPAISASDIGGKILVISNAVFAGSGVITATCASGDTYSMASTVTGHAQTDCGPAADTNTILTLTGADTNCGFAVGSTMMFEVVAENEWCVTINSAHTGNGSDFAAFS